MTVMIICALALYALIPVSVKASEMIYDNYQNKIEQTVEEAHRCLKQ